MEAIEKSKKVLNSSRLRHFPNGHIAALSGLAFCLAIFTALPSGDAEATRHTKKIDIPILSMDQSSERIDDTLLTSEEEQNQNTKKVEVKDGDNLSRIFSRAGLNDGDMMKLLNGHSESKRLASVYPGHTFEFTIDESRRLQQLTYVVDRLNSISFKWTGDGYEFHESSRTPDVRHAYGSAFITHSLYGAGSEARLDDKLIMELADIFGWDIDFALDIRQGDYFKVVYEELFLDGEKIGNGSIIAAEFINQGEKFQAIRYTNTRDETSYYTPDGKSMRKEFLRAPLDFRRISSNFNPRRLHPVSKRIKPHRGIDYAAATGTPVWSSGNGRVIASGYNKANGNYVFIQHGNNIQTKYLHLSKRFVKKGQKVRQKQKIGSVGATGLVTGPHLHYEFLMNGVHRNPRTIINRLPKARAIGSGELARFLSNTRQYVAELNKGRSATQYATAEKEPSTKSL